jgi:hypothetical protein
MQIMIINTHLLDYSRLYQTLNIGRTGEIILVNAFLNKFYDLYDNFKNVVLRGTHKSRQAYLISLEAGKLKDFITEAGGLRASVLLADYEKYASISDFVSCNQMEKKLFEEIEAFKETVVSMFA